MKTGDPNRLHQALNGQTETLYPKNKNETENRNPNDLHQALDDQIETIYPKIKLSTFSLTTKLSSSTTTSLPKNFNVLRKV